MVVTMNQVLALIDKDEPDYQAAARLGQEALPLLRQLIDADDPMRASKAAYLAGLIGGADATSILEHAATHREPTVRVAAAHALRTTQSDEILGRLLDDMDAGVRKVALRAAKASGSPQLRSKVSAMAKEDPAEHIRAMAKEIENELN